MTGVCDSLNRNKLAFFGPNLVQLNPCDSDTEVKEVIVIEILIGCIRFKIKFWKREQATDEPVACLL